MDSIGERLRQIREHLKLSQTAAAVTFGVTQGYVSRLEKNSIDVPNSLLQLFITKWNIDINWLLTGKGSMFSSKEKGQSMGFSPDLLELVVSTIEEIFIKESLHLSPKKKALLIRLIYEQLSSKVEKDRSANKNLPISSYFDYDTAKTFIGIASNF